MREVLITLRPRVSVHGVQRHACLGGQEAGHAARRDIGRTAGRIGAIEVPERICELARRIDATLEREEIRRARIGSCELRSRRVRLVREIVAAAEMDGGVDELARPAPDLALRCGIGVLPVVQHVGEHLGGRPGQVGAWVGERVPNRDVHDVDVMRAKDLPHARHERRQAVRRNEVLLEHVRGSRPGIRLELAHIVARLVVAPRDWVAAEDPRIDNVLANPAAQATAADDRVGRPMHSAGLIRRLNVVGDRERVRGARIRHGVDPLVRRRIDVGVVKDDVRVWLNLAAEEAEVIGDGKRAVESLHVRVGCEIQGDIGNDSECAVSAHCAEEELRVLGRARANDASVREHERDGAHGADERTLSDVATVRVHGECAAHGEGVVRLHDLDGQPCRVDRSAARRASAFPSGRSPCARRYRADDALELAEVELKPIGCGGLAAHAVTSAANGDGAGARGDDARNLLHRLRRYDLAHLDRIEGGDFRSPRSSSRSARRDVLRAPWTTRSG